MPAPPYPYNGSGVLGLLADTIDITADVLNKRSITTSYIITGEILEPVLIKNGIILTTECKRALPRITFVGQAYPLGGTNGSNTGTADNVVIGVENKPAQKEGDSIVFKSEVLHNGGTKEELNTKLRIAVERLSGTAGQTFKISLFGETGGAEKSTVAELTVDSAGDISSIITLVEQEINARITQFNALNDSISAENFRAIAEETLLQQGIYATVTAINEERLRALDAEHNLNLRINGIENVGKEYADKAEQNAKDYTDEKLVFYLTETEVYTAINERLQGLLLFRGFIGTDEPTVGMKVGDLWLNTDTLPTLTTLTVSAKVYDGTQWGDNQDVNLSLFNMFSLADGTAHYIFVTAGGFLWEQVNFTVDLSEYQTIAGSLEIVDAALVTANGYTDSQVSAEQTARAAADAALQSAIDNEITERLSAVTGEQSDRAAAITEHNSSVSAHSDIRSLIAEKLGDAPKDNKQYARENGNWQEVTGGGGSDTSHDITIEGAGTEDNPLSVAAFVNLSISMAISNALNQTY